MKLGIGHCFSI